MNTPTRNVAANDDAITTGPDLSGPALQPRETDYAERRDTLWIITLGPSAWALHFVVCYALTAVVCAKRGVSVEVEAVDLRTGLAAAILLAYLPTPFAPEDPFARHVLLVAAIAPLLAAIVSWPARRLPDGAVLVAAADDPARAARTGLIEQGRTIATGGENAEEIPSCQSCHGPWPHPVSGD